jgi:lipopolysaccharide export system permease protein
MRLLDRYLLRELIVPLGYCLAGFLIFWVSFDLMSELKVFQKVQVTAGQLCWYYVIKTPELLVTIMPVAFLLALLYALNQLGRHNEIVAIRGAGIGLWRLGVPFLGVGFAFSLISFALNELVVPDAAEQAEWIVSQGAAKAGANINPEWRQSLNFRNHRADRIWNIAAYNQRSAEMIHPQVDSRLPDGSRYILFAERAFRTNENWAFINVQQWTNQLGTNQIPTLNRTSMLVVTNFDETPEVIHSEIKISSLSNIRAAKRIHLSLGEILDYKKLHPTLEPRDAALLNTQLYGRLAAPWTSFIVALIALPIGAASSGRRNVFAGVANSIFICFTYFMLLRLGLVLGTSGFMPAWLAAWLPNLAFGGLGLVLLARYR